MKIKALGVKNFRSLKQIFMKDLHDMVILIGENASGKTTILEAMELFLSSYTPLASSYQRGLTDDDWYLWYMGQAPEEEPIEFQITLSLDPDEIEELVGIASAKHKQKREFHEILSGFIMRPFGEDLKVNRSMVRKNNHLYYQNDLIKWSSITLQRQGDNYSAPGVEFNPNDFARAVDSMLKKSFTYISLGRENRPKAAHDSILDSVVKEELVKIGEDATPPGITAWNRRRKKREKQIWGQQLEQLECRGKRLFLLKRGISLPLELEGGGYQAVLNLLEKVETGGDIVAIEEPENHLHPALQKRLVDELKQVVTKDKKQILLATHSPFIIDRINLKSIWFIYSQGPESKSVNTTTEEELSNAFWKIGVKPSDFLFANGVLVVEGPTDKDVYTDWARKIGKPFEDVAVLVIDAEGCGNITKYLNSEVIQRTTFRLYCLADKNAKWVKEKVGDVVPKENILFLDKGDLEDYYAREIVLHFAKEMAPEGKEIPTEIKVGETVRKLNELLCEDCRKRSKGWWKRKLADKIIDEMKPDEIDDELKEKLGEIVSLKPLR